MALLHHTRENIQDLINIPPTSRLSELAIKLSPVSDSGKPLYPTREEEVSG